MGHQLITALSAIATALIGLAIISVLVSSNAKTKDVISAAGGAFTDIIKATVAPVTGGSTGLFTGNNVNVTVPSLLNTQNIAQLFN